MRCMGCIKERIRDECFMFLFGVDTDDSLSFTLTFQHPIVNASHYTAHFVYRHAEERMGIDSRCKLHIKNWNKLPGGWARLIGRVLVPKLTSIISAPLDIEGAKLLDFACYSEDRVAYWFRTVIDLTSKRRTDDARRKCPISHEY
ncbi:hypothetical protein WG66_012968 [Moniliophthora roreri]|nr:hypothetical protein WG66_012968 [Moniliophthora roreri]